MPWIDFGFFYNMCRLHFGIKFLPHQIQIPLFMLSRMTMGDARSKRRIKCAKNVVKKKLSKLPLILLTLKVAWLFICAYHVNNTTFWSYLLWTIESTMNRLETDRLYCKLQNVSPTGSFQVHFLLFDTFQFYLVISSSCWDKFYNFDFLKLWCNFLIEIYYVARWKNQSILKNRLKQELKLQHVKWLFGIDVSRFLGCLEGVWRGGGGGAGAKGRGRG